jgi:spore coat protein CotF
MSEHQTRLTSSEIAALWSAYQSNTMSVCVFKYFLNHVDDAEVRYILEYTLDSSQRNVQKVVDILQKENQNIPVGFTEVDANATAPRLYSDAVYLYYLKQMSKISLSTYGVALPTSAHSDVRNFLSSALSSSTELYNKVADILLSKGLFIRPPYISTAHHNDYVTKQSYMGGILNLNPRPLNVIEITHLKANTETNILGQFLFTGFSQVANSKKVRQYMIRGKNISQKHVQLFTSILVQDNLPAPIEWDMEVTDSTIPPFSDKLMMFFSSALTASGISNYATSSAASLRTDIATTYTRITAEIAQYATDGVKIQIDNGWLEEPPQNIDRKELAKV